MNKKEIKQKVSEGYIHFRTIIEIVGKPKKHIEDTIKKYVEQIGENQNYEICKKDIEKATKTDDGFYVAFADVEVLSKDIKGIIGFCFDYMPASIEVLDPEELRYDNVGVTDFLNDLMGKLHSVDAVAKQLNLNNRHLNENINALATNFVGFAAKIKPMSIDSLAKFTGLKKEVLTPFLKGMVKSGKLKKEKDTYIA
ncbi:hypothetical protein GOV05_05420 [Candidatus Woesearchaeota archaeon]|nr:hypothetical protein [Candidatus Woesearchaeota archaeon]